MLALSGCSSPPDGPSDPPAPATSPAPTLRLFDGFDLYAGKMQYASLRPNGDLIISGERVAHVSGKLDVSVNGKRVGGIDRDGSLQAPHLKRRFRTTIKRDKDRFRTAEAVDLTTDGDKSWRLRLRGRQIVGLAPTAPVVQVSRPTSADMQQAIFLVLVLATANEHGDAPLRHPQLSKLIAPTASMAAIATVTATRSHPKSKPSDFVEGTWCAGGDKHGVGESVTLEFTAPVVLSDIHFSKTKSHEASEFHVSRAEVTTDTNYRIEVRSRQGYSVSARLPVEAIKRVTLRIIEVRKSRAPAGKHKRTCIGVSNVRRNRSYVSLKVAKQR